MRTIKFRGKRIDNGKWVYGDLFQPLGHYPIIINTEPDNKGKVANIRTGVQKETVGQFTGLTDKNGNEIYEGDILCWSDDKDRTFPMVVEYRHGAFGIVFTRNYFKSIADNPNFTFNPLDTDVDVEIIGNIHDNPELINGNYKEKEL